MRKLLVLLLGCLSVAAAFNVALDVYQQAHFRATAPLAAFAPSLAAGQAFEAHLAGTADPAELRRLARVEYARRLDRDRLIVALLGATNRVNGITTVRGGLLLILSLGALAVALRPRIAQTAPAPPLESTPDT